MNEAKVHPAAKENPGFLLWQVSTLWSRSTSEALKPSGLNHPQFVILAVIDSVKGKGVSQKEIEKQVVLDSKPALHLLRSLQVKKLVEIDEKNKYQLTAAGAKVFAEILPIIGNADAAFFTSINLKDSQMITTLQTLAHANSSE